jgi:hypothetical protein
LRFEEVNDVTWKLTDGEMTNVPACHGKWAGFRTTKAVAARIRDGAGARKEGVRFAVGAELGR